MPACKFTSQYYDYEISDWVNFDCQEEDPLASGFCIFHDKDYLQDKTNYEEHKRAVLDRLKRKVNHAISNNEPLFCIGFQLPDFSLSDLSNSKEFTKSVYFNDSQFFGKADFSKAKFQGGASFDGANFQGFADFKEAKFQGDAYFGGAKFQRVRFSRANFQGIAIFSGANFQGYESPFSEAKFKGEAFSAFFDGAKFQGDAYFFRSRFQEVRFSGANFQGDAVFTETKFQGDAVFDKAKFKGVAILNNSEFYDRTYFSGQFNSETKFNYVLFEGKEKIHFDVEDLSNVSFINTDITGVRFSDKARWGGGGGGENTKEDRFKVVDERLLEERIKGSDGNTKDVNLGSIKAVYRSLRENYEYRMRYDEAGQFFIREMELKRKYREVPSKEVEDNSLEIKENNWFRRNLFSLTGWYYHLSRYGESIWRPTLAGLVIVFLSTLFWLMQSNPTVEPSLSTTECNPNVISNATMTNTSNFIGLCEYGIRNDAHWLKAFERSLADFLPLLPTGDFKMGIIDFVIKIIGGAVTFGLIAIALRRRFERRYRH